jgi:hypothetical protein
MKKSRPSGPAESNRRTSPLGDGEQVAPNPDLFLDEDALVRLAMRELNGRLPPGFLARARGSLFASSDDDSPPGALAASPSSGHAHGRRTVLSHELDQRGWTTRDLADAIGLPPSEAHALARGHQRMTPEVARKLAHVFATSEEFWL